MFYNNLLIISINLLLVICYNEAQDYNGKRNSDLFETEANNLIEESYQNCAKSLSFCYGLPNDCIANKNCQILLSAIPVNDTNKSVEFEIFGSIDGASANKYVAMSLSQSTSMGGSITICALRNDSKVVLDNGFNERRRSEPIRKVDGIALEESEYKNGLFRCKWRRSSVTYVEGHEYNLDNNSYYIQIARGDWNPSTDYIRKHTNRSSTSYPINLRSQTENTAAPPLSEDIYDQCFKGQKLCFGYPKGCINSKDCKILGSSFPNQSKVTFELLAPIESNNQNNRYVAYGLSKTAKMGGSVAQCYLDANGSPKFGLSFNKYGEHHNEPVQNVSGINLVSSQYKDGALRCVWNRDLNTSVSGETFDLANNRYYIQLAKGGMNEDSLGFHNLDMISSENTENLQSTGIVSAAGVSVYIKWHGSLMIFSWVGCVSTGIIMARYYRDDWPSISIFGVKIWFLVHRLIMVTGWSSMIASIVLIWYYKNTWSGPHAHPVLGIISVLFATLQIINSFFRPHPGTDYRWIFDWVHWLEGNLAQILAFCAILMAHILWVNVYLPNSFFWVFMSFIFFYLLIQDAMKKLLFQKPEVNRLKSSTQESFSIDEQHLPNDSVIRTKMIVLGIYSLVVFALTLTLILLIATY